MCKVSEIVKMYDNNENYDIMVGWTNGTNEINQYKHYVSMNALYYEKNTKKGSNNHGHMKSSSMLYYVSQEDDFNNWWCEHDTRHVYTGH